MTDFSDIPLPKQHEKEQRPPGRLRNLLRANRIERLTVTLDRFYAEPPELLFGRLDRFVRESNCYEHSRLPQSLALTFDDHLGLLEGTHRWTAHIVKADGGCQVLLSGIAREHNRRNAELGLAEGGRILDALVPVTGGG